MRDKKTLAMVAWLCIALVFAGLLGFLVLDAPGLMVELQPSSQTFDEFEVIVSNQSQHVIRDILVIQQGNNPKQLGLIPVLLPGEKKSFVIAAQGSRVVVAALAPFHKTAEKNAVLEPKKPFEVTIDVPVRIVKDAAFQVLVRVCNNSTETNLSITETHQPTFFNSEFQTKELVVLTNECKNSFFGFLPQFSGPTVVFFNVKSDTLSVSFEKEIIIAAS